MHPHGTTCQEHPKYSSTKQELEVASNTRAWVRFHLQQAALPLSVEQYIKKILSLVTAALDKKAFCWYKNAASKIKQVLYRPWKSWTYLEEGLGS